MDDPADIRAVERYLDAWGRGDLAGVLGSYHPDLTLVWPGSHPFAGEHAGLDAALTALAALQERTERRLDRVVSVTARADHVAAEIVERWTCGEVARTLRFRTCDGRIRSCTVVEHDAASVDAEHSRS
jgi:ketosteroid isomerase-like protein